MFNSPISFHGLIVNLVLSTEHNSIIWIYQSLSIYLLKAILVASKCWQGWISYCRHLCEGFHVDINVLLLISRSMSTGWYGNSMFIFVRNHRFVLQSGYFHFALPPEMNKGSHGSTSSQTLSVILNVGQSTRCLVIENLFSLKLYSALTLHWSFCWAQFIHAFPYLTPQIKITS